MHYSRGAIITVCVLAMQTHFVFALSKVRSFSRWSSSCYDSAPIFWRNRDSVVSKIAWWNSEWTYFNRFSLLWGPICTLAAAIYLLLIDWLKLKMFCPSFTPFCCDTFYLFCGSLCLKQSSPHVSEGKTRRCCWAIGIPYIFSRTILYFTFFLSSICLLSSLEVN